MRSALTLLGVLLRDATRHPLQGAVSVLGIALGLSVLIAVFAAGRASRDSFARTFEAVAGRTTHQLLAAGGLEPEALSRALAQDGVIAAQPVIEGVLPVIGWTGRRAEDAPRQDTDLQARFASEPPLRLLGVDPFSVRPFITLEEVEPSSPGAGDPLADRAVFTDFLTVPGAILAPHAWAAERGLARGDTIVVASSGLRRVLPIAGILPETAFPEATSALALADLATADELLGRGGRLDRIDLIVAEGADLSALPAAGETLERPAQRGERAGRLTDAFRMNLLALSTLALLVGSYLVFNAAQFAVVRREPLLGQLRCLGASRGALLSAVVLETAGVGLVGGLIGLAGGSLLARLLVGDVARTVSTLYGFVRPESAAIRPLEALGFVALSVVVAVIAGWLPARDAARTPPRLVGSRSAQEDAFTRRVPQLLMVALAGLVLTAGALLWPTRAKEAGFVAAFGILLMGGALVPPLLSLVLPRLRAFAEARGSVVFALASGEIERSLSRTGIATSALAVALAMAVGVMVMVSSFEREVRTWVESALVADLYVSPFRQEHSVDDARIPPAALEAARRFEGMRRLDTLRARDAVVDGRLIRVLGMDSPGGEALSGRTFLSGSRDAAWGRMLAGEALVSEPFAQRFQREVSDVVSIPARGGELRVRIAGIVRDYALDRGYVLLAEPTYVAAFGDDGIANLALTLDEGTDAALAARRLREDFARAEGSPLIEVVANAALKDEVGIAFQQTFAVTRVLQALATGLALAGIATALASLFLERLREMATLRAVGASLAQVAGLFVAQGGMLAAFAALAALPVGAALSWLLVDVVNVRSFGWGIRLWWPVGDIAQVVLLALAAGVLASLAPWLLARRVDIASALREE